MKPRLIIAPGLLACVLAAPAASAAGWQIAVDLPGQSPALLALAFLVPTGFALLAAVSGPAERTPDVALAALLALGLSALAYFACGFAFQFGGLGLWHPSPLYEPLNVYWSAFGPEYGRGWGMLGLRGFGMADGANAPAGFQLFLAQLPLATTATMIPLLALRRRVPATIALLAGLLTAAVAFPILGNWIWGGGWLAQLGENLALGHGAVDLGGAGPVHLAGGTLTLMAILIFAPRRAARDARTAPIPLPEAHLPVLGILGALLLVVGWGALLLAQPLPDWSTLSVELIGMNVMLAAGAGALLPGLYTWFVAGRPDASMAARGLAAGLIAVSAGAPFMAGWSAAAIGAVAGILVPLSTYFILERLRLDDPGGVIAMHGIGGIIGLLAPAFFATGLYGAGWNQMGGASYLGVSGQGVTGLLAAAGRQPDWPGQLTAQAAAIGASIIFPGLLGFIVFQAIHRLIRSWHMAGIEWQRPIWLDGEQPVQSAGASEPTASPPSVVTVTAAADDEEQVTPVNETPHHPPDEIDANHSTSGAGEIAPQP
jgi:ammonium transporter, Amt family